MSNDLFVECPIHLDAVPITDILVFKCGHGFCEPCLEEHLAHPQSNHLSCPTCRKPVRRKEAFPLFLSPAQPSTGATQSSHPMHESSHARMTRELKEARAAHATCSGQISELQREIDTLRQEDAYHNQTIHHLRGRCGKLEERLEKEEDNFARAREESSRMKEEVTKLQVENHKTSKALEQALQEVRDQVERVKTFQRYVERYKHKCNLERKKRKAVENANHLRAADDSLMVVDSNAPDMLQHNEYDFGWLLDDGCRVKGDQFNIPGDEDMESERGSEDEVQLNDSGTIGKQREDQGPRPPLQFHSDWNLGLETFGGPSSRNSRKRKHESERMGGSSIVKVKLPVKAVVHKQGGPLAIDRQGRINGLVALGSRQKLNSKN